LRASAANVGTPGNVTCTISNPNSTCQDSTNCYSSAALALMSIEETTTIGGGAATAAPWFCTFEGSL